MTTLSFDTSRAALALAGAFLFSGLMLAEPVSARDRDQFEGVSIGVQAGWERRSIDEVIPVSPTDIRLTDSADAAVFGGFVGYDHQFDHFVLGIEAGATLNGKTLRTQLPGAGSIEIDPRWSADVSVRAGFTPARNLLVYARGGYALNRNRARAFAVGETEPVAASSATDDGWLLGGGIEYAVRDGFSIRAEYRRREFDGSLASDQVLGGVAFRF
jgi:outer membrane immunogenic protein